MRSIGLPILVAAQDAAICNGQIITTIAAFSRRGRWDNMLIPEERQIVAVVIRIRLGWLVHCVAWQVYRGKEFVWD